LTSSWGWDYGNACSELRVDGWKDSSRQTASRQDISEQTSSFAVSILVAVVMVAGTLTVVAVLLLVRLGTKEPVLTEMLGTTREPGFLWNASEIAERSAAPRDHIRFIIVVA